MFIRFATVFFILNGLMALDASAQLKQDIMLTCVTEFPTTSFIGETDGDYLKLKIIHHNGAKYMPISSAIITPNDLPLLSKKAKLLTALGDRQDLVFARENCRINNDNTLYCFQGKSFETESGNKVEPSSLSTSFISTKMLDFLFEQTSVRVIFKIDGEDAEITMNYERNECGAFNQNKIK